MTTRFKKERFHILTGPQSLFERVQNKMSTIETLKLTKHSLERLNSRKIPTYVIDTLEHFNTNKWKLQTVEVRTDTGKFINSTWELEYNGNLYWITIGFGNVVETIVIKDSSGQGKIIIGGPLFDFVEKVNKELILRENK